MHKTSFCVVYVTCPDKVTAKKISNSAVEQKLAACVNIMPIINSVYLWQGKIENSEELLLMIKTGEKHLESLEKLIHEIHPYEVPEFIVLPIIGGSKEYLSWIESRLA